MDPRPTRILLADDHALVRRGLRLILDGELYDENLTMSRRDNNAARKFISALLVSVGILPNDGQIRFDHKHDDRHAGLHMMTRFFRAERDLSAVVAGEDISLQRGERIGMNFQYTYSAEAFRWLVTGHGGLTILDEYPSPDGRFLTVICRK